MRNEHAQLYMAKAQLGIILTYVDVLSTIDVRVFVQTYLCAPVLRVCVWCVCVQVAQPIFSTIMRWIYDGELEDTYHEVMCSHEYTLPLSHN